MVNVFSNVKRKIFPENLKVSNIRVVTKSKHIFSKSIVELLSELFFKRNNIGYNFILKQLINTHF